MGLHSLIKEGKYSKTFYAKLVDCFFCITTIISPRLNTKLRYKMNFGVYPNLKSPKTFNEKLVWLKLNKYIRDPLVIKCADKYRVREYIRDCGCADILNQLVAVYDKADEIVWKDLPEQFVLKWNFGAGYNIICKDKKKLDEIAVKQRMDKWGRTRPWLSYSEMQYKYAPKKIICEKLLIDENEYSIPDYKVYCFNGEPKAIFVMHDRGKQIKSEFFDIQWRPLENSNKYISPEHITTKPECFDKMLSVSRILSKPFEFVRCDYYIVSGKLYFGEMTFTPAGGVFTSKTKIDGHDMTDYLNIGV